MTKSFITRAAIASALAATSAANANAENYRDNPFTLTYAGALKANVAGAVNLHPVTYKLNGLDIAANVYTPAHYDPKARAKAWPVIVIAHPNGGVKEQVAGL